MTEQRVSLVVFAVACCCLLGVQGAQVAVAQKTICSNSDGVGGCQSSRAHSSQRSSTGPNGVTSGECTYTNAAGQTIKVKYQRFLDGTVNAEANSGNDPANELEQCQAAVEVGQQAAQENYQQVSSQIQAEHQRLQEEIQRQQQQLQEEILQQQQAIFNQKDFPFSNAFNPIPFPNFNRAGFGPHF